MGSPCHHSYLFFMVVATLAITGGIQALKFTVTNRAKHTAGGRLFDSKIGEGYAKMMMNFATNFIWLKFRQTTPNDRELVIQIDLFIDEMEQTSTSQLKDQIGKINISANHIASCPDGYVKQDFLNLLFYELTHTLQWKARGQIPVALKDGIAAHMVLVSVNYVRPRGWVEIGGGDKWDESPDVTAQFFKHCSARCPQFLARLNEKMKESYNEKYFYELTGMTISKAWKEYKHLYGGHPR